MELPKNVTQIGEQDKSYKIYIEDYVVSYMKQMNRYAEDKEIAVALYGRRSEEQSLTYCFIYGAAKLNFMQKAVKHLSQAQEQEIERLHKKYFDGFAFIGYLVLNGEMIEGIQLWEKTGCHFVKGYACFYEKNDCMLAYMLDNRNEEAKPEEYEQSKYDEIRQRQEERKQQFFEQEGNTARGTRRERSCSDIEKRMKGMRFAAASMFVLLCMVSIVTLQTENVGQEAGQKIKSLVSNLLGENDPKEDTIETMNGDRINTLVAEEQLAAAIRKENELQQTIALVTTPEPQEEQNLQENATDAPPIPAPQPEITTPPTPEPTSAPTPEPAIEPVQSQTVQNYYTIQAGDTLIGISKNMYGTENYVNEICRLNNITNPDNIQKGQKILLP